MSKSAEDVLKTAILLERRGKSFYSIAARETKSETIRKIFTMMAEEEDEHIKFLSRQFAEFQKSGEFLESEESALADGKIAAEILSDEVKDEISAAGFEAAAISAAIDFENRAIEVYQERANETSDPNEKAMYEMLADWERTHHQLLFRLNEDLKEQVWNDNNFWPF